MSLLSWERGLKYGLSLVVITMRIVAPLVGAWIEIGILFVAKIGIRRSSRGSVD